MKFEIDTESLVYIIFGCVVVLIVMQVASCQKQNNQMEFMKIEQQMGKK